MRGLDEGASTRLLVNAAKLIASGIAPSLACDTAVSDPGTLCGACWGKTPFIAGQCCDRCGTPLPGDDGSVACCDDCLRIARPWGRGRAALVYGDTGRSLVLGLKHGDRHDIAGPAGRWMARAAAALIRPDTLVAPVLKAKRERLEEERRLEAERLAKEQEEASKPPGQKQRKKNAVPPTAKHRTKF